MMINALNMLQQSVALNPEEIEKNHNEYKKGSLL